MKIEGLTGVKAWKGTGPIPDGDYPMTVTKADESVSSNGNPMTEFELRVFKGEYEGGVQWDRLVVVAPSGTKKGTLGKVRQVFEALDIPITDDIDTKGGAIYIGKKALISLRTSPNTYNGETKDRQEVVAWAPYVKAGETIGSNGLRVDPPADDDDDIPF